MAVAQPCYPVQVAHGHVQALAEMGVDHILVPNIADAEADESNSCPAHYCPWNQTLPYILRVAPGLERSFEAKLLVPTLHFQLGPAQVKSAMAECMKPLGIGRRASDRAVDAAYAAQREFQGACWISAGARSKCWSSRASRAWCWPAAATTSTTAASIAIFRASYGTATAPT